MDKHLHIISFDVPYPADYGGIIDVYYRIKALHETGIKIHLHCFTKSNNAQPALDKYCASVHYYKRSKWPALNIPFIVSSRDNKELNDRLAKDDYPILAEGIHCTAFIKNDRFASRKIFIRLHNTEHLYYARLASHEKNFLKRIYFKRESSALKKYENHIATKGTLLAISTTDKDLFEKEFDAKHVQFLPAFTAHDKISIPNESGSYCLYHGNLSVNENEEAVIWLIQNIFARSGLPFVVAGRKTSQRLKKIIALYDNITLVDDPDDDALNSIFNDTAVHVLPAFNSTGVKIKLLNALFSGRHVLVNSAAVEGSGLETLCEIADTPEAFIARINMLLGTPVNEEAISRRTSLLENDYSNEKNALKLSAWIW